MKQTKRWGQHSPESVREYYRKNILGTYRDIQYNIISTCITGFNKFWEQQLYYWIVGRRPSGEKITWKGESSYEIIRANIAGEQMINQFIINLTHKLTGEPQNE